MKRLLITLTITILFAASLFVVGCSEKKAEKVEEAVEEAVEETVETVADTAAVIVDTTAVVE